MKPLTKRAEKALRKSIESWRETARADQPQPRDDSDCALCALYHSEENGDCERCPIFHFTGARDCIGSTEFMRYCDGKFEPDQVRRDLAASEVCFLMDVLDAGLAARAERDKAKGRKS